MDSKKIKIIQLMLRNKINFMAISLKTVFMKKIFLLLLICAGMVACNTTSEPPGASINGLFTAMKSGNLEEMEKYVSANDVVMMNFGEQILMRADSETVKRMKAKITDGFKNEVKDVTYSLKNEKVDGNNATVDVEITKDGKKDTHKFNLIKEAGMWKVVMSKSGDGMFNSMKGNMGRESRGMQDEIKKLENMHPDSIKKGLQMVEKIFDSAMIKRKDK
jgi:Domain of unknown function (DUF4878)